MRSGARHLPGMPARLLSGVAALIAWLVLASAAAAHVERPGYWPDPEADTTVSPPAGGGVPAARSLASAVADSSTKVVCRPDSLTRAIDAIDSARTDGYTLRPSEPARFLTQAEADELTQINEDLFDLCSYDEIQPAVGDSGNNGRVVVMPGLYTEPTARAQPTNDPACDEFRVDGDRPGQIGTAASYAYQYHCPNDQNLVAVIGRELGDGVDPDPPLWNRHGIPNLGACIRCNLQLEGSGPAPDDVIVEVGDPGAGNGGPNGVGAAKHVGIRADRADGFLLRNVTVRHAREHGIYVLESDGFQLDRFKTYFSRLYGVLTFVEDHGLMQNCDGAGHGDSAIYPGAAVESGVQRPPGTRARLNQEIRRCDLHHNLAGYSGTNGNAVHIHDNRIYDNSLGIQTDVVTGAGHPGYPGDSMVVEDNEIYSNNFNPYDEGSDVEPSFPFPVGTGMWIAGGNHHTIRNNHVYDNWRRGTMLFAVPDGLICGPLAEGNEQAGCDPLSLSTSHYNSYYDNTMGAGPDGTADPNGTDFWWDQFPGNRGNCWFRNSGPGPITSDPPLLLPDCDDGRDPARSVGTGNPKNEAELLACFVAFATGDFDPNGPCPWFVTPPEPDANGGGPAVSLGAPPPTRRPAPAPRAPARTDVQLSELSCRDWNAAGSASRVEMVDKVRAFAGGVVVDGERAVGTGAVLTDSEGQRLYDAWCGRGYAQGFLLYKLYTWAAAFARR